MKTFRICTIFLLPAVLLAVRAEPLQFLHGAKVGRSLLEKDASEVTTVHVHLKALKNKEHSELKERILDPNFHAKSVLTLDEESRQARVGLVVKTLQDVHSHAQADLLSHIQDNLVQGKSAEEAPKVIPLWITNSIILRDVSVAQVKELANHPDISHIEEDQIYSFNDPVEGNLTQTQFKAGGLIDNGNQWGVDAVGAPEVWRQGNRGEGIVVGVTDTGVTVEHEALKNNYREEHGWLDPSTNTPRPTDVQGHGTHCAGSIVGQTKGIGVAPGAKWIACRGCTRDGCPGSNLQQCGQFMACPSNNSDNCMAPHIVSNSWGSQNFFGFDGSYREVIKVWNISGIIPVFALGNAGRERGCRSTGNPGDEPNVFGIGASAVDGSIASFSSLGPTKKLFFFADRIKPDFAAPGQDIWSAAYKTTKEYTKMSGTSMACPHASGVIALMMSARLRQNGEILTYKQIECAIQNGTTPHSPNFFRASRNCGRISESKFPNNHAGWGLVSAPKAIKNTPEKKILQC